MPLFVRIGVACSGAAGATPDLEQSQPASGVFFAAPDHGNFMIAIPADAAAGSIVVTIDRKTRLKRGH